MGLMEYFLWQAFVTLLVIIDPLAVLPVYIGLTQEGTDESRRLVARKACFIGLILLLSFALIGEKLLSTLGISEPAFRIAGGFLLLLAAIEMVMGKNIGFRASSERESQAVSQNQNNQQDVAVYPLAIPLIAGPGAFTSLVVLTNHAKTIGLMANVGVILLTILVLLITYICLRASAPIMKILGTTGTNVLTRVFGIILAGLAFENVITGLLIVFRKT